MTPSEVSNLLDHVNHTELYQTARRVGMTVPASATRQELMNYLLGELELPSEIKHNVDEWRHAIMGFLLDHWQVVRSQLECPAKSGDPLSCFECVDTQVIACIVDNPQNELLISLKRKR